MPGDMGAPLRTGNDCPLSTSRDEVIPGAKSSTDTQAGLPLHYRQIRTISVVSGGIMVWGLLAWAAATSAALTMGQATAPDSTGESATGPQCELHVWPSEGFRTTYYGWFHGGTVDGALKGREGYSPLAADMLSTERQIVELEKLPISDLLGLKDYRQIVHREALSSKAIRTGVERHADGSPPCYAELMIDTIVFQHNVLQGKGINTIARFRRFDTDTQAQSYGGFTVQPVAIPVSGSDVARPDDVAVAFGAAFAKSIVAFGGDVRANLEKRRKK